MPRQNNQRRQSRQLDRTTNTVVKGMTDIAVIGTAGIVGIGLLGAAGSLFKK